MFSCCPARIVVTTEITSCFVLQLSNCSLFYKKGLKQTQSIKAERWFNTEDSMCASVASDQQILTVGCSRGVVELYDLAENATLLRTISLYDWGQLAYSPVSCIAWAPDNCALAVGWKFRGLTVWSASGCRIMCTIRQTGLSSVSSPMVKPNQDLKFEPFFGGTLQVHWDEFGYKLYAVEEKSLEGILAFSFGKCCLNRGLSGTSYSRQIIYGEDRVLIVQPDDTDELRIVHLNLPVTYISRNWPVLHVASKDGTYLAVAGVHGLILYDLRFKKWRVFRDVTQEQKIGCKGLLWLSKIIVVCNYIESSNTIVLVTMSFFLGMQSFESSNTATGEIVPPNTLLGKPIVMDVFQDYILVTYRPFDVHIFHVKILGELSPSSTPILQLSTVRELSIMTAKSHPASMKFIPDFTEDSSEKNKSRLLETSSQQPSRCLILRANGELSVLDLDDGHEQLLSNSLDHEFEFDREVYPLGLLPNIGVVVGVSQRMPFSACSEFPCFERTFASSSDHFTLAPTPSSSGVSADIDQSEKAISLAMLIGFCLKTSLTNEKQTARDKNEEALHLPCLSAEKPHFSHCLEWFLFTVFDAEVSRQNTTKNQLSSVMSPSGNSLLDKTCNLIKNFPEYLGVVVSVARKTDAHHWGDLFSAAGRSTEYVHLLSADLFSLLFEDCFQRRWYRTAACYILATLDESLYELAGELVRFLLRSGREYENSTTESDSSLLNFWAISFSALHPADNHLIREDLSPHIASVKNILENHATHLMSGKELSKLVAFVKGTQFDLVEYLQQERQGSAQLENFASGSGKRSSVVALKDLVVVLAFVRNSSLFDVVLDVLRGQYLQMDTLQSRLDAEFLLAHMCSVKFKEWIVVLATLLRRTEVLDLFRYDLRLWNAYKRTLKSHAPFHGYLDLLNALAEQLASIPDLQLQNGLAVVSDPSSNRL
ncbi:hypothetical protein ZIOFF_054880 [Zingiber officinale]|uniref:RIC1 C-terminal alpha solenoid region domain-containing protein n=1 Tax=Zingiber officinale TaxID=94328 RepID=A0A8J5FGL5_ZINOF|nr:hypothetical protein ZIOFF_054880 [Zingiber officinale]